MSPAATQPVTVDIQDRRILGAFTCLDAVTGLIVPNPFSLTIAQPSNGKWIVKANRSGTYVIFNGPNLGAATTQFIPTAWPPQTSFEVTLQDPMRQYLPRRASVSTALTVPAITPAPAGSATNPVAIAALTQTGSVFNPQRVAAYRAPSSVFDPNWAVIHVSVSRAGTTPPQGLPWAVVQVTRNSDNTVLANGLADTSGEALVAVAGLTVDTNTTGTGPVQLLTTAVTVKAYFDPTNLTQPPGWISDPDTVLGNLSNTSLVTGTQLLQLGSGQELYMNFALSA